MTGSNTESGLSAPRRFGGDLSFADFTRVTQVSYARILAKLRAYLGSNRRAVGIEIIFQGERIHSPLEMILFTVGNEFICRWE